MRKLKELLSQSGSESNTSNVGKVNLYSYFYIKTSNQDGQVVQGEYVVIIRFLR